MFEEIAAGVFSAEHQVAEGKNAIVFGRRSALAIDGGTYEKEGRAMADFICDKGYQPDRLALTHGHGDHVLGAKPLAAGEVYAHAKTPGVIRRHAVSWAERQERDIEELIGELAMPTITYTQELYIDLGDLSVRFFPTPGHSEDGVSAYIKEHKLLIGGDAVVTGIVPAIGDGDSRVLEASLRVLAQMDIEVLLPGHGPAVYGALEARGWIEWEADYLAEARARVRGLLDEGLAGESLLDEVSFDELVKGRLSAEKHGMRKRHRASVEVILQEELRGKD
ncbi:MAG: glyoxylase-like metal-dependent hydrolase (beta-lactamase superfamily II) [Candidatus Latescibacterota bacterium]|jgi:glyoxylase-like metal-dependent hydrolase (beta-lactamase superfamily II)